MKDLIFWLTVLALAGCVVWLRAHNHGGRITIKSDEYGWATEVCEERGWRTIIINHRNQLTVKCRGGGVHLYDASGRK